MKKPPKVFISYSYDSEPHKQWVLHLATKLRENGVDAILDQWELAPGKEISRFMEEGISSSDRVLVICTEGYVKKADGGSGGVGYERMLASREISANLGTQKFIPLARSQRKPPSLPLFLGTRLYIDFSDDDLFEARLEQLLRDLHESPLLANQVPSES